MSRTTGPATSGQGQPRRRARTTDGHIETVELGFDEALDAAGATIVDATTVMLLQLAALRGPFVR